MRHLSSYQAAYDHEGEMAAARERDIEARIPHVDHDIVSEAYTESASADHWKLASLACRMEAMLTDARVVAAIGQVIRDMQVMDASIAAQVKDDFFKSLRRESDVYEAAVWEVAEFDVDAMEASA